jgi:hypothetical protein
MVRGPRMASRPGWLYIPGQKKKERKKEYNIESYSAPHPIWGRPTPAQPGSESSNSELRRPSSDNDLGREHLQLLPCLSFDHPLVIPVFTMATPRRNGQLSSCEPCRTSKLRCDHTSPICGRCERRGLHCTYHPAPLTQSLTGIRPPKKRRVIYESDPPSNISRLHNENDVWTRKKASVSAPGFWGQTSYSEAMITFPLTKSESISVLGC